MHYSLSGEGRGQSLIAGEVTFMYLVCIWKKIIKETGKKKKKEMKHRVRIIEQPRLEGT